MNNPTVQVTKRCSKCGEEKPATAEFFYRNATGRRGVVAVCRVCWSACAKLKRDATRKPQRPYADVFAERFWSKVNRDGPVPGHVPDIGDCWEWTAYRGPYGYGEVGRKHPRRVEQAHRVSWELEHGVSAGDACVLHACDNAGCVGPSHLFLGTRTDNMFDKMRKGRQTRGERHGHAILTEPIVRQIRAWRAEGRSRYGIAKELGMSQGAIAAIIQGRTWKHVV